jgi:rhodanese-related sulfurtransferase
MPTTVKREDVGRLVESEGAQLVEVLPLEEYEWAHLPGARHIWLREIGERGPRDWTRGDRSSSTATTFSET